MPPLAQLSNDPVTNSPINTMPEIPGGPEAPPDPNLVNALRKRQPPPGMEDIPMDVTFAGGANSGGGG